MGKVRTWEMGVADTSAGHHPCKDSREREEVGFRKTRGLVDLSQVRATESRDGPFERGANETDRDQTGNKSKSERGPSDTGVE